jgi:hypothetical protein
VTDGWLDPKLTLLFAGKDDNDFAAAIMNGSFGEALCPSQMSAVGRPGQSD